MDIDYDYDEDDIEESIDTLEIGITRVNGMPAMFSSRSTIDDRYLAVGRIDDDEDLSNGEIITMLVEQSSKYMSRGGLDPKWALAQSGSTYYLFSPLMSSTGTSIVYSFYNSRDCFVLAGVRFINYVEEAEYELTANNTFARRAILTMMNDLNPRRISKMPIEQVFDGTIDKLGSTSNLSKQDVIDHADLLVNLLKSMLNDGTWKLQKPSRERIDRYMLSLDSSQRGFGIQLQLYIGDKFEPVLSSFDSIRRQSIQRLVDHVIMMVIELARKSDKIACVRIDTA